MKLIVRKYWNEKRRVLNINLLFAWLVIAPITAILIQYSMDQVDYSFDLRTSSIYALWLTGAFCVLSMLVNLLVILIEFANHFWTELNYNNIAYWILIFIIWIVPISYLIFIIYIM